MEQVGFDSETVGNVRVLLHSDVWQQFFAPSLEAIRKDWLNQLADPSKKRKDEQPDDYIRGCIATVQWFLDLPQAVIDEADAQQARREEEAAPEQHWHNRAELGTP